MTSFADHRIIIVGLFLPTSTAAVFHPVPAANPSPAPRSGKVLPKVTDEAISTSEETSLPSTGLPPAAPATTAQIPPTATKFSLQRPTHNRRASSLNLLKQPAASIVDDLLASRKPGGTLNLPSTGTLTVKQNGDDDEEDTTPRGERSNPFASFAASDTSLSAKDRAEVARGRDRGDVQIDTPAQPEAGATPLYRRLSRKQSKGSGSLSITREVSVGPWEIETNPNANGGLHNAVQSVAHEMRAGKVWVGVLGPETDDISPDMRTAIEAQMETRESIPVWVSDADFNGCYDKFCHQVLWPSLHYIIPDAPKTSVMYESSSFVQYKAVNEAFADTVARIWKEGDVIWINDYHLLLLPQLLRARLPTAAISFFLHVAFPSSEIFRCLAARESLLRGMLGADLIGFQTHSYARHFRQTVSRILSVEATPKGIQLFGSSGLEVGKSPDLAHPAVAVKVHNGTDHGTDHGHAKTALEKAEEELDCSSRATASEHSFVDVAVFPMGIDIQSLTRRRKEKEVGEWVIALRERYKGMKMIVARDKLDEVQGVRQKFLGFERFLEKNKEFQGKVMLIQVALSTTSINELQGNVTDVISRINMKFSTLTYQPIIFFHTQDVTFSQYLALLTVADCFIVTSLREGMALRTHEFIECQAERQRPLILSEFTGSFSFSGFRACLAINPWDIQMTADAILTSLTMPLDEAAKRWKELHAHVNAQTAQAFTRAFLNRTVRVHYKHHIKDSLVIPTLDTAAVRGRYRRAAEGQGKRLILVDLERTLWQHDTSPPPQKGEVPERVIKLLERLAADEKNDVWGLSGLPVEGKLENIGNKLLNVGICAEHGCYMKPKGSTEWITMTESMSTAWMAPCMEILQYFTERTPNSFIDKRKATIVWRFDLTDDEGDRSWARRQAAEAQNHIYDSLGERFRLRIIPSPSSFIVLPKVLGRSTAVGSILQSGGQSEATLNLDATVGTQQWPTPGMDAEQYTYILAVGSDGSLMNRLKRIKNAETVYTGLRMTGGSNWRCEPEEIYRAFEEILSDEA